MDDQDKMTITDAVNAEKEIPPYPAPERGVKVIDYRHLSNPSKYYCLVVGNKQLLVRDGAPYLINKNKYTVALKLAKVYNAIIMRADKAIESAKRGGLEIHWLKIVEKI